MSKKVFLFLLVPAVLLLCGAIGLLVFEPATKNEKKSDALSVLTTDTHKGEGAAPATKKQAATPREKKDTSGIKGAAAKPAKETPADKADQKDSPLDLKAMFLQKIEQVVKKSTNGLYNLSVGGLDVDILGSTVSMQDVSLRPDNAVLRSMQAQGKVPANVFSVSLGSFTIEGINLDDVINKKRMDYKLVKLVNPVIEINQLKQGSSGGKQSKGEFQQQFLQQMEKLSIDNVQVSGGEITVRNKEKGTLQQLHNVEVVLKDILLNNATRNDNNRFLFAKEAHLEFHDFKTKKDLYTFAVKTVAVDANQHRVELKDIAYGTGLSKQAFSAKHQKATEMYDLTLPRLVVTGINWWPTFNGEAFVADKMETTGGKVSIFLDRSLPSQQKTGNFPNQMLESAPLTINLQKAVLNDLSISYQEHNPNSGLNGTITFDHATLNINNISNASGNKEPVVMQGTAMLMNKVPVKATLSLSMDSAKQGVFSANLSSDGFDGHAVNAVAEPLGMMHVEKGTVQKLQAQVEGNELGASGNVLLEYKNLKLALLEKDKNDSCLNKRHFTSFIANFFVLKNANPKGSKAPQSKPAQFTRDPKNGFMNLIWKTTLIGVLKTLGAPTKLATK